MTTYIGSPISSELAQDLDAFFVRVRAADRPRDHRSEGIDLILRMTRESLDYYFLRSVDLLGIGTLSKKAVKLGLDTSVRGISVFVKSIGRAISDEQVVKLSHLVEDLVLEVEDDEGDETDSDGLDPGRATSGVVV